MAKAYRAIPYEEVLATFSPGRQERIKARAAELIAEEFALRDLRRAKQITQEQVAEKLGGKQVYVSRLEKRGDMKLSSLRNYVRALGGELQLMVTFPEGGSARIKALGATKSGRTKTVRSPAAKSKAVKRKAAKRKAAKKAAAR